MGRSWATAALVWLVACDASFDTSWRKPAALVDAGGDGGDLDAAPPLPDATTPPEFDGSVPPLPSIDCSALVRDAGLDASCEIDCVAACVAWCGRTDAGCGDAEAHMPCWQCREGGVPPTL